MTSYQKLKLENEMLWKALEHQIRFSYKYEDAVQRQLNDIRWEIIRKLYENKN